MYYLLSVIIPVYNAEKYIDDTLNALCKQTVFENLEIIIVDDGSEDYSLEICNTYRLKYSNIKVISQTNQGVSTARNVGLLNATGEYVTFLDADDYVCENLYEQELELVKSNHADIGIVDFYKQHPDGKKIKYRKDFYKSWESNNDVLKDFFSGVVGNQVVDKIFALEIVKNIEFPKKFKIGEDMWFVFLALCKAQKVVMDTEIAGYVYMIRESSAMTGKFSSKFFDPVVLSKRMCVDISNNSDLEEYAHAHLVHETCKALEYVYRHHAENEYIENVKKLKLELKNYSLKSGYKYLVRKQFYGFLLLRISPKLYMLAHRLMKIG